MVKKYRVGLTGEEQEELRALAFAKAGLRATFWKHAYILAANSMEFQSD